MSYRFLQSETVECALRRIATEQLGLVLESATAPDPAADLPHMIRKRCKKMRGLLRLVRGSFPGYHTEQRVLRDAARRIASARDTGARLETLDRLCALDRDRIAPGNIALIRPWLEEVRSAALQSDDYRAALAATLSALSQQLERVRGWTLECQGFGALAHGLRRTYRRSRHALERARSHPTPERMHELRKRVKYHRFHLELLHDAWPGPMSAWAGEARRLGDLLGEHHDLAMLAHTLRERAPDGPVAAAAARLIPGMEAHSRQLERDSLGLASRLYVEKPSAFEHRMQSYWQSWRPPGSD